MFHLSLRGLSVAIPPPLFAALGVAFTAAGLALYTFGLAALVVPTPGSVSALTLTAEVYFVVTLFGMALVLVDVNRALSRRIGRIKSKGEAPVSPGWIVPYIASVKRYRRSFMASALVYGAFYAVITSMIVYQSMVDFGQAYSVTFPSVQMTPVTAAPLFTPVVTVYLTNHSGLLLVPLTVLLLIATSILVGLNFALATFAFDSRARGSGRGWVAGVGAIVGLFTGCPTCAGLFFANFLGGAGAVSFATILGYYQPAFILLSIPVLLVAPYLTSRSLSKVYREGCVVVRQPA
jgi:hypothetical protein